MSQQNLASMVITAEQEARILSGIAEIETTLVGLIALDPDDRASLLMLGPKSDHFARGTIRLAQQNPTLVPPSMDLAGAVADLEARDRLERIDAALKRLSTLVDDTKAALGSDIMAFARTIYGMFKVLGPAHGISEAVEEIGYRWARSRRKPKPTTDE